MTLTPRERILRALDALLPYRHGFVNQAFDEAGYRSKRIVADIAPLAHAIRAEWQGVFSARLARPVLNYVHELIDVRNRFAHSQPFDDDEARRASDTIRLMAKAIGAPLGEYDRLASDDARVDKPGGGTSAAPATLRTAATSRPAQLIGRRVSQRDVMRDIWTRCAPDEERAIREYSAAEERGEVVRKQNTSGLDSERYARALLSDGRKKGWL